MPAEIISSMLGIEESDLKILAGGVVSAVVLYEEKGGDGKITSSLVAKHTAKAAGEISGPFFQRDKERLLEPAPATQALDLHILVRLDRSGRCLVPKVLGFSRKKNVTFMEDFNKLGFKMMQNQLVEGTIEADFGSLIGKELAILVSEMKKLSENDQMEGEFAKPITPVENPSHQIEERTEELRVTLGYDAEFRERIQSIIKNLHGDGKTPAATDTHLKNMATDGKRVMFYDFGRTIYADSDFTLPNFAAHIGLGILVGSLTKEVGIDFLKKLVASYSEQTEIETGTKEIDEPKFVEYFLSEILHRGKARWIDPNIFKPAEPYSAEQIKDSVSIALEYMVKEILRKDRQTFRISDLNDCLVKYRELIESGKFVLDS